MPTFAHAIPRFILIIGCLLLLGCQSDDDANTDLTLEQQLIGTWHLDALRADVQLDGEDYKVYLIKLADSLGIAPTEVALGLLFFEGRFTQEVLGLQPTMNLTAANLFDFKRLNAEPIVGSWQLSEDEQQLTLVSEEEEILVFSMVSLDETGLALEMDGSYNFLLNLPQIIQQLDIRLEMNWVTDEPEE